MEAQFLFFFSALGVFNALLISFYFFFYKKPKTISNFFFGFLLLMLAIRVGKSVFYYFNSELASIYIKTGLSACILIGPALYFYVKSVVNPEKKNLYWPIHFLLLLASAIFIGYSFPETHDPKIGPFHWMRIIYAIWIAYTIASGYLLRHVILKIFKKNERFSGLDFWLLSVFIGNLIIWIAYNTVAYTS